MLQYSFFFYTLKGVDLPMSLRFKQILEDMKDDL